MNTPIEGSGDGGAGGSAGASGSSGEAGESGSSGTGGVSGAGSGGVSGSGGTSGSGGVSGSGGSSGTGGIGGTVNFVVNGSQKLQTIDGFGVSANSLSWNNGELIPAIDMLIDGGSTLWRVSIDNMDWEETNDNSDPFTFNWDVYRAIYSSPKFEELWATLAYLNSKGIHDPIINFFGPTSEWMGWSSINNNQNDEFVESVVSLLYYARFNRNISFNAVAPLNETDHDGIEGPLTSPSQYGVIMEKIAQRLDALRMSDVRLLGPETADVDAATDLYIPAMQSKPLVMSKSLAFGVHNYLGDLGVELTGWYWVTETSLFSHAFTFVQDGASAVFIWDGFDSVYEHAILAGRGTNPPNDAGNGPALLAYNTNTHLYTPRRVYYDFAQLAKWTKRGSVRVGVTENFNGLEPVAFIDPVSGRVTIVGRNTGGAVSLVGRLDNSPSTNVLHYIRTSNTENLAVQSDIPVVGNQFAVSIPGNCVFTLYGP